LNDVSNGILEAMDVLSADGKAPDLDLRAHSIDADDKRHGGLLVLVHE
jgi:hypothetical protein